MNNYKRIYADNAATTPVYPEVAAEIDRCMNDIWGNPSSIHKDGLAARDVLDDARSKTAALLGAEAAEIYFTSGGTEADNWAVKGAAYAARNEKSRNKIVTTKIEHHAVLRSCETLGKEGFEVEYVGVSSDGILKLDELRRAVDEKTALVAVMLANNEIGTLQPVAEAAEIAHSVGALMFCDAVQAVGNIPVNVKALGVDLLSLSGHKFGAPGGIGALYIRNGASVANFVDGGGQERARRGGTENLPYISGIARALEISVAEFTDTERVRALRDRLTDGLLGIPYSKLNGAREPRLPGNVNVSFEYIESESLVLWLDAMGISASAGAACSSKSVEVSHVLLAMGITAKQAAGALRLTLSHLNTEEEVDRIIFAVREAVGKLRNMNPLFSAVRADGKA